MIDCTLNLKLKLKKFCKDYDMESKYFTFFQKKVRKEERDKKRLEQ